MFRMKSTHKAGLGRWLAAGMTLLAPPAIAQSVPNAPVLPAAPPNNPADRLAANLVILSQNPRDVNALTEAGLSAIAVGDGDAALSFLARAEEISPNNGKIKAAIGSALVLKEKPTDALKLFSEAVALGVPEQLVARDRGLAYDLRGDSKRAQRDYALALRSGADDELTIRYALSLGISGDDKKAFDLLDPLLRQQNRMAWRARAFVLAMNGDTRGAEAVANSVMPGGSGPSMSPFLRRLATLNPAERALAVNFGIMPSDGQRYAMVETGDPYRPAGAGTASDGLIPAGDPFGPRPQDTAETPRRTEPVSKEPRRRPGHEGEVLAVSGPPPSSPAPGAALPEKPATNDAAAARPGSMSQRVGARIGPVDPARLPPEVRDLLKPGTTAPGDEKTRVTITKETTLPPPSGVSTLPAVPVATAPSETEVTRFEIPNAAPKSGPAPAAIAPPPAEAKRAPVSVEAPAAIAERPSGSDLGAILAGLQIEEESVAGPIPNAAELKAARIAAQRKAAADAKAQAAAKAAKEAKEAERQALLKNPARIWVQVATGNNEAGLPGTWKKLKDKAPDVFKGQSASSVPFKATNRLLVGPFKSGAEARAMVNAMVKAGLSGSTFTSEAGQVVAKVTPR